MKSIKLEITELATLKFLIENEIEAINKNIAKMEKLEKMSATIKMEKLLNILKKMEV